MKIHQIKYKWNITTFYQINQIRLSFKFTFYQYIENCQSEMKFNEITQLFIENYLPSNLRHLLNCCIALVFYPISWWICVQPFDIANVVFQGLQELTQKSFLHAISHWDQMGKCRVGGSCTITQINMIYI